MQENRSCEESLFLLSLISRHHSRSPILSPVHCFFHTLLITCSSSTHSTRKQNHIPQPFHSRLPYKPTTSIIPSLPHSPPFHRISSPPPTPSNPPRLPQTPHCTSTHTQNPNKQECGTTHTPSPPSHFLPILDVGPRNPSFNTLEVHFRTMEMFKTAVYSVECLKEKPIASPVVGTVIQRVTHRM